MRRNSLGVVLKCILNFSDPIMKCLPEPTHLVASAGDLTDTTGKDRYGITCPNPRSGSVPQEMLLNFCMLNEK